MAKIAHGSTYRGNLASLGAFSTSFVLPALCNGTIISYRIEAQGTNGFSGDWFFGLQVEGSDVISGADRPQITSGDLIDEKTGLNIPVSFGDDMLPTIDERGLGSITGPIRVIIVVNDAGEALADEIHTATAKSPVDADELGFWDSVSHALRKATFLSAWTDYFKGKADGLYAALTGSQTIAGVKTFSSSPIVPTPSGANDAANKSYVDGAVAGLSWKQSVRVATTANGTLASGFENGDTIDGVVLATGDRILIKDQSTASQNGIYIVNVSGAPTRATDADSGAELVNASVYVQEGTSNADKQFVCTTNAPISIGSTAITFTVFSSGGGALDDLSDVVISGASEGDGLFRNSGGNFVNGKYFGNGTTGRTSVWLDDTNHRTWIGDTNANGNDTHLIADDVDELIYASKLLQYETLLTPTDDKDLTNKKYVDDAVVAGGGYTNEQAQDAVGGILDNGTTGDINFTYDDPTPKISGAIKSSVALTGNPTAPTQAGGNNSTRIATTAFVIAEIASSVAGLLDFKGDQDCSANPNYPAALKGDAYYVTVAGKIGGASGKSVDVGDVFVAKADNAGGAEGSVGSSWFVLEHNLAGALLAANNLSDIANAGTARTNLGVAIGSNVQAWDADLDALAALSGTNTIYYRSAANTWTAVTIGSGLSFSGGNLTATGGGGGGGGLTWSEVTGTSNSMAVNNAYVSNNASLVTHTLPSTAAIGDRVKVVGKGAGGWRIAQNASQEVKLMAGGLDGRDETTSGTGGSLSSSDQYDSIELVCITANNVWAAIDVKSGGLAVV